jgi:hypothetical protein
VTTARQWLILALAASMGAWAGYHVGRPPTCDTLRLQASVSKRAADICTTELVGCSLSHDQIKAVLADQEAVKACP